MSSRVEDAVENDERRFLDGLDTAVTLDTLLDVAHHVLDLCFKY